MYRATSVGVAAAALTAAALTAAAVAAAASEEEQEDLGRVALLLRRCRGVMRLVEQPDGSFVLGVGLSDDELADPALTIEVGEGGPMGEEGLSELEGQEVRGGSQGRGVGSASERCLEMGVRGAAVLRSVPEAEGQEPPHHT